MTHCAKCGAELIGSRKFCAACGTPVSDPRSTGQNPAISSAPPDPRPRAPSQPYGPPPPNSGVNPFAQTANPSSSNVASAYGPPPAAPVSPLAVSNLASERHAFQAAASGAPPPSAGTAGGQGRHIPGTQLMPSVPQPPASAPGVPPPPRRQERTQVMGAFPPNMAPPAGATDRGSGPPAAPYAPAQPIPTPPPMAAPPPPMAAPPPPASNASPPPAGYAPPPPAGYAPPPPAAHVPQAPHAPWGAAQAAPPYAPPPGPAPGSHVQVTWANGHRYPGTVQQISGGQCLVAFPDGQQHWVPLQYVALA